MIEKVLVVGGTGFVGRWVRYAQPDGLRVVYLGRADYELRRWKYHAWDAIVHLANISPVEVLEHAQKFGTRILYASSGIVYMDGNESEYRLNKLDYEKECRDSGLDIVIARLFTFSGEGLDDGKAIVQFERAAREGKPLRIWGDGNCVRSYMPGEELGAWMWAILLRGKKGEAYDVGNDEPVTLLELARRYSDNIIVENRVRDPMPVYLPRDTAKTRALLK